MYIILDAFYFYVTLIIDFADIQFFEHIKIFTA